MGGGVEEQIRIIPPPFLPPEKHPFHKRIRKARPLTSIGGAFIPTPPYPNLGFVAMGSVVSMATETFFFFSSSSSQWDREEEEERDGFINTPPPSPPPPLPVWSAIVIRGGNRFGSCVLLPLIAPLLFWFCCCFLGLVRGGCLSTLSVWLLLPVEETLVYD